jgi:membrane-bound metal-dependent hydrolase YbcI (DUF457 family)
MPNGRTHAVVGMISGAGAVYLLSADQPEGSRVLELCGGLLGGYVGGKLPDWLEPAYCSWHREFAHSVTAGVSVFELGRRFVCSWEDWCRQRANEIEFRRAQLPPGSPQAYLFGLAELFLRMLAGFLAGLVAGYVSHLALDAGTPRGIRLI